MSNIYETKIIYTPDDFYYDTPITDKSFLGFYVDRNIEKSDGDNFVKVEKRHENRPYVLSFDLYGSNKFYWIFPRLNMDILIDPIRDLKEGMVLRVPTQERINRFFAG